jgi:predicted porin
MALAVAAPAMAEGGVTLYGVIDLGGEVIAGHSRLVRLVSGGNWSSRLGFRGTEELAGGLAVDFTLETAIGVDDSTPIQGGALFGRQAFVALRSPVGTLALGRQNSSIFIATNDFSEFYNGITGASTTSIGGFAGGYEPVRGVAPTAKPPAAGASINGGPGRINNAVRYTTPTYAGLKASISYGAGEISGDTFGTRLIDASVRYTSGSIDAMLSYIDDKVAGTAGNASTNVATTTVAAGYGFGHGIHIDGGFLAVDDRRPANLDGTGLWLGGDYRVGSNEVRLQWVQNMPQRTPTGRSNAYAIAYLRELSKRTTAYTSFALFRGDSVGSLRYNMPLPDGLVTPSDSNPRLTEFTLGIRHRF